MIFIADNGVLVLMLAIYCIRIIYVMRLNEYFIPVAGEWVSDERAGIG